MLNWILRRQRFELQVLMVCAGNICRSPTAEAVLRKHLDGAGLAKRIGVDSAGTYPEPGWPADPRSKAVAAKRGYDLSRARARPVVPLDFERFDLILGMDDSNLERLRDLCPAGQQGKLALLLEIGGRPMGLREIPDPYFGGPEGFERVLDLIEPACLAVASDLRSRLAS